MEFIVYMLAGKTLTDYNGLFSPNDFFFKKNDKTILNYISNNEQFIFVKIILQYKKWMKHLVYIQT